MNKLTLLLSLSFFSLSAVANQSSNLAFVSLATVMASEGDAKQVEQLERHPIECPGTNVLNSFRMVRGQENDFNYHFTCTTALLNKAIVHRSTELKDVSRGETIYLDRHFIACEANEAISSFEMTVNPGITDGLSVINFDYACADVGLSDVSEHETPLNFDGRGENVYLDRHHIACPSHKVLNAFRVVRGGESDLKYVFQCGVPKGPEVDENGFDLEGVHFETGDYRDAQGFDKAGLDLQGYDRGGFSARGFNRDGLHRFTKKAIDPQGYDVLGYNDRRFNRDHIHEQTQTRFDAEGYDHEGYRYSGFNRANLHKETKSKYDETGHNVDGYDRNNFSKYGFFGDTWRRVNPLGFYKDETHAETATKFDRTGHDIRGFDAFGFNREGVHFQTRNDRDPAGFNKAGFDTNGVARV